MAEFEVTPRRRASGDQYMDALDAASRNLPMQAKAHHLDSEEARREHRQLLSWFFYEREKQAANRLEQSMDADFYDNQQWDPEDAAIVKARGQMPLVFNEVAAMVDWLIGTERRTRVDWRVLPRSEDDVKLADVKTNVLKYVSDINRVPFNRSRAFADAAKVGVGWVDDGARDDPTQDILYDRYEDWRNVLWDSACYELDLSDARYLFRWRWVDEDVALLMFPERRDQILAAMDESMSTEPEEDTWYLGNKVEASGVLYASGAGVMVDAKRRRIKLIECQYRKPARVKMVADGAFRGAFLDQNDAVLAEQVAREGATIIDKIAMRVHVAVFTEAHLLALGPSTYRHNRFSLTPIWAYRRGRDRLPYGAIRRVRDLQQDLNKRASKALFMLNTNQIIADSDAVDDWELAREEADRPDGVITKKRGSEFTLRRDTDAATGQVQMMTLDAQKIQNAVGINNENLGRQTNAASGEAIKARQLQGSVNTTEFFDNLRLAVQIQGEKQLSLVEQFYTEQKVLRLTGAKGRIEWVKINQPEMQPDGSVRFINDITTAAADFIVSDADYAGTLRQVMFDSINQLAQRLPPEMAIRLFLLAMEFSDLPNKDEITDALRRMIGERDPDKEMTPEEMQQAEEQMAMQAEAMQLQRETAMAALEEARAKVREINARADKLMAEAGSLQGGEDQTAVLQVQEQAAQEIERLTDALRKAQMEAANRTLQINRDADVRLEVANIERDTKLQVVQLQRAADKQIDALMGRLEAMNQSIGEVGKQASEAARAAETAAKTAEQIGKGAEEAQRAAKEAGKVAEQAVKAAEKVGGEMEKVGQVMKQSAENHAKADAPAVAPVTINFEAGAIQVDAKNPAGSKTINLQMGDQNVTGTIKQAGGDK